MKYKIVLELENGKIVCWTGKADNREHAEGLAIACKVRQYNQQIYSIVSVN